MSSRKSKGGAVKRPACTTSWRRGVARVLVGFLALGPGDRTVSAGDGQAAPAPAPAPEAGPAEAVADPLEQLSPPPVRPEEPLPVPPVLPVVGPAWVLRGPNPTFNGQVEGVTNRPVSGAIHAVVAH